MAQTITPPPEADEPLARSSRVWRILAVVAALAMALFWIWILAGGPRKANPDRLDDRAYASQAEQRCQVLLRELKALPQAQAIDSATERADVLDRATAMATSTVDDLEAAAPRTGDDRVRLEGWLGDWRQYLGDRTDFATRLRADPDARFFVSENERLRDPVDKTIEVFADVNDMPSCATPGDVG